MVLGLIELLSKELLDVQLHICVQLLEQLLVVLRASQKEVLGSVARALQHVQLHVHASDIRGTTDHSAKHRLYTGQDCPFLFKTA